jgi:hypothetical protein
LKFEQNASQIVEEANFEDEDDSLEDAAGLTVARREKSLVEYHFRDSLPAFKNPEEKIQVWKVIKDSIGKDLSKIAVPVYFNEPVGMLQKCSEVMEYQELLVKANNTPDAAMRMILVSMFCLGQYKSTLNRTTKPFNPLLGETYELDRPDFRYFSEQVEHHPPISACYAQHKNNQWSYWMDTNMQTKFWGASLEVIQLALVHVHLPNYDEEYTLVRPTSTMHNLIFGNMYLEHSGNLICEKIVEGGQAVDPAQRQKFTVDFKKTGWSKKSWACVEGRIPVR